MHRALRILILAATIAWSVEVASGAGSTVPTDPDGYTAFAAARLRADLPGKQVTIVGPLTLKIGKDQQLNLDRPFDACHRNPEDCSAVTESFLHNMAAAQRDMEMVATRERLRVVVRTQDYVNQLKSLGQPGKAVVLVTRPLAGPLVALCYVDFPTVMRPASTDDLATLHLTTDQAFALALKNMSSELPSVAPTAGQTTGRSIGILDHSAYESSRLAMHDDWAKVAAAMHGHLLVAVPGAHVVLYAEEVDAASLAAMSTLAQKAYGLDERPISAVVFRWTKSGWEVARP